MSRLAFCVLLLCGASTVSAYDYGCNCDQDSCIGTWLQPRGGCWQNIWDTYGAERHYWGCEPRCKPCRIGRGLGGYGAAADCGCGCDAGIPVTTEIPASAPAEPVPAAAPTPTEPSSPSDAPPAKSVPSVKKTTWIMPRAKFATPAFQSWAN